MSHLFTFTLSFMCGETDAIVITRSPQTETWCKHTPLTCEVRMQPVDCSRKFYNALGQRHLGCPTQPEIDPPKQSTEEMSELANSLSIWTWSDSSLFSCYGVSVMVQFLNQGRKKRLRQYVVSHIVAPALLLGINSSVHTWAQNFLLKIVFKC